MARTTMAIQTDYSQEQVYWILKEYFEKRGYLEKKYNGEVVIEKSLIPGLIAPHCLKVQISPNLVMLEGWVKAIKKELAADGSPVGGGPKRDLQKALDEIQSLLGRGHAPYSSAPYTEQQPSRHPGNVYPPQQPPQKPLPQPPQQNPGNPYPPQQGTFYSQQPQQPPIQNPASVYTSAPANTTFDTSSLKITSDQKKYAYLSVIIPAAIILYGLLTQEGSFGGILISVLGIYFAKTGMQSSKKAIAIVGMVINIICLILAIAYIVFLFVDII